MANEELVTLLKQGATDWNKWRDKNPEVIPDLSEADLGGANLSQADLSHANLNGANLSWANLSKANLRQANLRQAFLSEAKLSEANLCFASSGDADLSQADLKDAMLVKADLSGADLNGADLSERDHKSGFRKTSRIGIKKSANYPKRTIAKQANSTNRGILRGRIGMGSSGRNLVFLEPYAFGDSIPDPGRTAYGVVSGEES